MSTGRDILPLRIGVLTVSDGVAEGDREDLSGSMIEAWVSRRGYSVSERATVPDDVEPIASRLRAWADGSRCDVILTTGGTGLAERDVTPEATLSVVDRGAPGIAEAIRAHGRSSTPFASLGRGVAGIRGATLIVNLPGSPSGVGDGLTVLDGIVEHAGNLLRGHTGHD